MGRSQRDFGSSFILGTIQEPVEVENDLSQCCFRGDSADGPQGGVRPAAHLQSPTTLHVGSHGTP